MYISFGEHLCSCWTEIIIVMQRETNTQYQHTHFFIFLKAFRIGFSNDFPILFLTTFVHRSKLIIVDTNNCIRVGLGWILIARLRFDYSVIKYEVIL